MNNKSHELNNWTCGVIHHDKQKRRLPECRQCKNCGKWIGHGEFDSECFGRLPQEQESPEKDS